MSSTIMPDTASRIRTALYGLAVCDALGAPLEFGPRRYKSQYTTEMEHNYNFDLPPGHFTDDTSMALCLADSLIANNGKHDPLDQAARYVKWLDEGYMSSVPGHAFDVGNQTSQSLQYYRKKPELSTLEFVKKKFNEDHRCGNGSLMRVLPCALVAGTEEEAVELGRRSSEVTHPHGRCADCCALYCALVFRALKGARKEELATYVNEWLETKTRNKDELDAEVYKRLARYKSIQTWQDRSRDAIKSSGYVLDSLEAALWTFFTTDSFEEGAIEVVNLGDDADTVGAIYGGLAAAFYGTPGCIPEKWFSAMKEWDLVQKAADGMSELNAMSSAAHAA